VITHVSFDADDTLWEFERVMRASLEHVLHDLRAAHPDVPAVQRMTIEDLIAVRARFDAPDGPPASSLQELRRLAFVATLQELGRPDEELAARLTQRFMDGRSELIEPYDDVVPLLEQLAGRYVLGVVSNGNADLERCALRGRFAFRVHAHEHGVAKPDPALFEVVFAETGCRPDQLVHVGDDLALDVAGAQAAGVHAVWLNRVGLPNAGPVRPDAEIRTLAELPGLLERLG
jgi:HAD superfamily hydrolase (TIGR01509 family)